MRGSDHTLIFTITHPGNRGPSCIVYNPATGAPQVRPVSETQETERHCITSDDPPPSELNLADKYTIRELVTCSLPLLGSDPVSEGGLPH